MSRASEYLTKNWKLPKFDKREYTRWGWKCRFHKNLKLGKYVDIAFGTYILAKYPVILEDEVQIGQCCILITESSIDDKRGTIHIKSNARVGANSTIMPNVTIGENSIIGAMSFVNRDIPPNVVAYGIPARIVKWIKHKKN